MSDLRHAWQLRNACAAALELALDDVNEQLAAATVEELVDFLGGFSPARAPGPEWVQTFDRAIEQIWNVVDADRIAAVEGAFRARGPVWDAVANSLTPARGVALRAARWRPHGARRAAVVLR